MICLFIINNSFLLGVFFLTAIGMIHVGSNVVMNNPNVPYRVRWISVCFLIAIWIVYNFLFFEIFKKWCRLPS